MASARVENPEAATGAEEDEEDEKGHATCWETTEEVRKNNNEGDSQWEEEEGSDYGMNQYATGWRMRGVSVVFAATDWW